MTTSFHFDISLAQWSLNKAFFSNELAAVDFPRIARERYAIGAVEYVNQFFIDKANDSTFLQQLKQSALDHNVKNLLIMIDLEGELANADSRLRHTAVDNHKKWVDAAAFINCDAVRVNLHGFLSETEWVKVSTESLITLGEYAAQAGLKLLVENHGGLSAKIPRLIEIIRAVNLPNVGTMPDFGNFCISREVEGDLWKSACVEQYDPYQGVAEMMPFAGAVSAKTFDFDAQGNETSIDFQKMMSVIKASGYKGYIGVEYEGTRLSEDEGIRRNHALLQRWKI